MKVLLDERNAQQGFARFNFIGGFIATFIALVWLSMYALSHYFNVTAAHSNVTAALVSGGWKSAPVTGGAAGAASISAYLAWVLCGVCFYYLSLTLQKRDEDEEDEEDEED